AASPSIKAFRTEPNAVLFELQPPKAMPASSTAKHLMLALLVDGRNQSLCHQQPASHLPTDAGSLPRCV
ncbi:hypothetical protein, partial [Pseudomonas sp.]|uniref:hypothetical protein n=1 Tax=Pseudomonas sp. TaxID=306 RepID=UPI003BB1D4A9